MNEKKRKTGLDILNSYSAQIVKEVATIVPAARLADMSIKYGMIGMLRAAVENDYYAKHTNLTDAEQAIEKAISDLEKKVEKAVAG